MTISAMVKKARHDERAREEMITTALFAMAFVVGMFIGGYAVIKLMGW